MLRLIAQQPDPPEPAHAQRTPACQPIVLTVPRRYAEPARATFAAMHAHYLDSSVAHPAGLQPLSTMAGFARRFKSP